MQNAQRAANALKQNIGNVVVGKDEAVTLILIALICRGHVLIEDVPGVGKTMLASSIARSLDCSFKRIQFTPDVTPSDIIGFTAVNFKTGEMEYKRGSIMSQIVLADEINRTSPKTQSSLLEVMEECQATVDGVTYPMPKPFIVLATQNPVEFVGTYPLPEAQMDRFFMRVSLGYPTLDEETDILARYSGKTPPIQTLEPVLNADDILLLQRQVGDIYCAREARAYVASIAAATRKHAGLQLGISTRASIALVRASQASAMLSGRNYIIPEDIQQMARPVLSHRLTLSPDARSKGQSVDDILSTIFRQVTVPVRMP